MLDGKEIDLVNGEQLFIPHVGKLALCFSGGVESSLLMYLLLKYSSNEILAYTTAYSRKGFYEEQATQAVIDYCSTSGLDVSRITRHITKTTDANLFDNVNKDFDNSTFSMLYTGTNQLPPIEYMKSIDILIAHVNSNSELPKRHPDKTRDRFYHNGMLQVPFTNIDKKGIAQVYADQGLDDVFFNMTQSCINTKQYPMHCNQCPACAERYYGFGKV